MDRTWDAGCATATVRYYVVDAATAAVTRDARTFQAYDQQGYLDLLAECGLGDARLYDSLLSEPDPEQPELIALVARKS